jgi:hypothetical protein
MGRGYSPLRMWFLTHSSIVEHRLGPREISTAMIRVAAAGIARRTVEAVRAVKGAPNRILLAPSLHNKTLA